MTQTSKNVKNVENVLIGSEIIHNWTTANTMLPQSNDFTFHILEKKMLLLNFTTDWESYRSVLHVWDKVTERWERQSEIQMSKMQNIEYFTALNPPVKPLWT